MHDEDKLERLSEKTKDIDTRVRNNEEIIGKIIYELPSISAELKNISKIYSEKVDTVSLEKEVSQLKEVVLKLETNVEKLNNVVSQMTLQNMRENPRNFLSDIKSVFSPIGTLIALCISLFAVLK